MAIQAEEETITVTVKVKRGQTPQQVLDGTGRTQYGNYWVSPSMPLEVGEGEEEVEFVFFNRGFDFFDSEVEAERKKRGLVQDLAAQAQYNTDNPDFATDHPNGDIWKDGNGRCCGILFGCLGDERRVVVDFHFGGESDIRWFGGRKVQPS